MTEPQMLCAWTEGAALDLDCEEKAVWQLAFDENGVTRYIDSCEHHLSDLARGIKNLYDTERIILEELPE